MFVSTAKCLLLATLQQHCESKGLGACFLGSEKEGRLSSLNDAATATFSGTRPTHCHNDMNFLDLFHHFLLYTFVCSRATPTSYCYNGCSGHGTCQNYHCTCVPGYSGENCATVIEERALPILSVGTFHLTSRNFTSVTRKTSWLLVGFSSHSCEKCVAVESEYRQVLSRIHVPFARIDADKERGIVEDFPDLSLPALYMCGSQLRRCVVYDGHHVASDIERFVQRLTRPPTTLHHSIAEIKEHIATCRNDTTNTIDSIVVGFFRGEDHDDELEEYQEAAVRSLHISRIQFRHTVNSTVVTYFQQQGWFAHPPAVVVQACWTAAAAAAAPHATGEQARHAGQTRTSIALDEYYGSDTVPLWSWIQRVSLPLVGELLPSNYPTYEARGLPMLIAFFNLNEVSSTAVAQKWSPNRIQQVLERAATKYKDKIVVVYTNGALYQDRMRSLGIFKGVDALPAVTMNIMGDGKPVAPLFFNSVYKEESVVVMKAKASSKGKTTGTRAKMDALLSHRISNYCEQFLTGRLALWDGKKKGARANGRARATATVLNNGDRQARKETTKTHGKKNNALQNGIREHFSQDDAVIPVTTLDSSFNTIVLDETTDAVVLFHTEDGSCPSCEHLAPYYKKLATRMQALDINSVKIARMDVSKTPPPTDVDASHLPLIVLYRAYAKTPPYVYFSGIAKVRPLMDWVQQNVGKPIHYNVELPQFDGTDAQLFKQQLKAREEARRLHQNRRAVEERDEEL